MAISREHVLAPLAFEPIVLAKPWGGGRELTRLGLRVPEEPPTGEVWLVSDVEGRPSVVADGPAKGATLRELVSSFPREVLGHDAPHPGPRPASRGEGEGHGRFPLLVKLLEIEGRLSLQVHPDAAGAKRNGDGGSGKFEAWSVLSAKAAARVSLGLERTATRDEVRELVQSAKLEDRLNSFSPRAGDGYVISPGTVHAAGGGLLLLEVQETADVTYRLYDWGSKGLDGKPRELHLEKALACADLSGRSGRPAEPASRSLGKGVRSRAIVERGKGPFVFEILELDAGARVDLEGELPRVIVSLGGECSLVSRDRTRELAPGQALLLPAACRQASLVARAASRVARAFPLA